MDGEHGRVLVVGAGVNGSVIAAGLYRGGVDVTVLARGTRLQDLRELGIVIEDPFTHKRVVTRPPVLERLDPADCYDFVLVVVRKNQVAGLLPVLAANRSPNVAFLGNNLSGPQALVEALGRERVLMGAVYAAGKRDGSLIRAMVAKGVASPFGELDGTITPRLRQLAAILRQGGFKVDLNDAIVDFQMTHAVGVALIASLVMQHGGKLAELARARSDLQLYVTARQEAFEAMRLLGHRVVPKSEANMARLPAFLQVAGMQLLLASRLGEVGLAWHVSQAPDEMHQLAAELGELLNRAGLPAPAARQVLG